MSGKIILCEGYNDDGERCDRLAESGSGLLGIAYCNNHAKLAECPLTELEDAPDPLPLHQTFSD